MIERQRGKAAPAAGQASAQQQPPRGQERQGEPQSETVRANLPSTENWVIKGIVPGREGPPRRS